MVEILANSGPTSTVLSPDRGRVASFDLEGRLVTYFRQGSFFKRSLASDVYQRHRSDTSRWRLLDADEARSVLEDAWELARDLRSSGREDRELAERLEGIVEWTPNFLLAESERFAGAYAPISILPPDRYLSIVLQATRGCTWNRCTFCNFYQDRPFSVRSPQELERHASSVRELLGRDVARRRGVFLADGNALALSRRRLMPVFEISNRFFPGQEIWGFVDLYSGERHEPADWKELAEYGLAGVYVGMETGLDELLAFVDKPGSRGELVAFVDELKRAELQVGLIVMVGLGGRGYRDHHREATLEALAAMKLGARDVVFLSPFVEHRPSRYADRRAAQGLEPMAIDEVEDELATLASAVRRLGARASRYDIREFIY
jgi:radical SAM superfamily enzyme YgiQ (UPF0313 family)